MCEGQKVLLALTTEQIKLTTVNSCEFDLEICYTKFNQFRSRNVSSRIQIHVRPPTSTVQCHCHQTRTCPTVLYNKQTPSPNFKKSLQLSHCHWLTDGQTEGCVSTSHKAIFLFHSVQKGSTPPVFPPCPFHVATAAARAQCHAFVVPRSALYTGTQCISAEPYKQALSKQL